MKPMPAVHSAEAQATLHGLTRLSQGSLHSSSLNKGECCWQVLLQNFLDNLITSSIQAGSKLLCLHMLFQNGLRASTELWYGIDELQYRNHHHLPSIASCLSQHVQQMASRSCATGDYQAGWLCAYQHCKAATLCQKDLVG